MKETFDQQWDSRLIKNEPGFCEEIIDASKIIQVDGAGSIYHINFGIIFFSQTETWCFNRKHINNLPITTTSLYTTSSDNACWQDFILSFILLSDFIAYSLLRSSLFLFLSPASRLSVPLVYG